MGTLKEENDVLRQEVQELKETIKMGQERRGKLVYVKNLFEYKIESTPNIIEKKSVKEAEK